METRKVLRFFVILNLLLIVEACCGRENVTNSRIDNNEIEEYPDKLLINRKQNFGTVGTRTSSKLFEMLLQNDVESVSDMETKKIDPLEAGNKKILIFGKRIFESIKKHGLIEEDGRLLESGKYQIDWWKHSLRLEAMKKRLYEELKRNPELKSRLNSLGWRNNSEPISQQKKINVKNSAVQKPTMLANENEKNTVLYKIFVMGFKVQEPETDAPTKFSLNTFDQKDFGGMTANVEVIDVIREELPTSSNEEESTSNSSDYPSGQEVDSDRFLQLIPLIVDELRRGLMSDVERRAFRCIFGRRLWQLLERDASKRLAEMMDHDLANFFFKGELPERDLVNARQGRHSRQNALDEKKQKHARRIESITNTTIITTTKTTITTTITME